MVPPALHPTPYTLHPTPYTLHPTPYTLHPTSWTLHPTPYGRVGRVRTCCRANLAHVRQSRTDSGIGFQVKVFQMFQVLPSRFLGKSTFAGIVFCSGVPSSSRHVPSFRCRANMAQIRQSRPDSGLGSRVKGLDTFHVAPPLLGGGRPRPSQRCFKNVVTFWRGFEIVLLGADSSFFERFVNV